MGRVLWLVNHYAAMPQELGGTRHYWLSRGLSEHGWDVRLIRSSPTSERRPWVPSVEAIDGLEVTTLRGEPPSARGIRRIRGWMSFSSWLLDPRATQHLPRPDAVMGSTVHLGAAWAARALARRHGAPFIFEVRDLWPETLIAMGALRRHSPPAESMLRLERSLARSAALIVSPLSGVGRYMADAHGIPEDRFVWVSNGVHFANYANVPAPAPTGLRLQYFGAIGNANDVGSIVRAVGLANQRLDEPVLLEVRGRGPLRDELMETALGDAQLRSVVSFPPGVPSQEVPAAMAWGNGLVLVVRDLPDLYKFGISMNKLFDYLASGRWIVMGSAVPDNPIADAPGLTVTQPSAEALAEAIADLARMPPSERNDIAGANAALARDTFDYTVLAGRLAASLDLVLSEGAGS